MPPDESTTTLLPSEFSKVRLQCHVSEDISAPPSEHVQRRLSSFEPEANISAKGIKAKVENKLQYEQYLEELEPIRQELGIELKEHMYPNLGAYK